MDFSDKELDTLARSLSMAYSDARQMGDSDLMEEIMEIRLKISREVTRRELEG